MHLNQGIRDYPDYQDDKDVLHAIQVDAMETIRTRIWRHRLAAYEDLMSSHNQNQH